jgi:NTE family protein
LEGGGALGLAHIGVLEWLEEHRIPIDYIAGTMGGLVGGIYATELHPSEIHRLVNELDWDKMLRGQPVYSDLSYRRKQDLRAFQNYSHLACGKAWVRLAE